MRSHKYKEFSSLEEIMQKVGEKPTIDSHNNTEDGKLETAVE